MSTENTRTLIQLHPIQVQSNLEIAPSIFLLSFKRDFTFRAGQVIGLGLAPSDDPRLYSIASGENDPLVSILYNIKPDGHLTPNLAHFRAGDNLWITPPFGNYEGSEAPAYWIAAGTGLAPFLSMFRSGLGSNKTLVHGGRTIESFYFAEELREAFGERYIRCSSAENGEGVFQGRSTHLALPSGLTHLESDFSVSLMILNVWETLTHV